MLLTALYVACTTCYNRRNITFPVRDGEIALMQVTRERMQAGENRVAGVANVHQAARERRERFLAEVRPHRGYSH